MPFDKHYFSQFKDDIKEEHDKFDTHVESTDLGNDGCDHRGRVKAAPGGLVCSKCHAGWQGGQLNVLLDHFNGVVK